MNWRLWLTLLLAAVVLSTYAQADHDDEFDDDDFDDDEFDDDEFDDDEFDDDEFDDDIEKADDCVGVENLTQTGQTETSVTIEWDIAAAPLKYRLNINGILNVEFLCSALRCSREVSDLAPCTTNDLILVAVCSSTDGESESPESPIQASTSFSVPGAVTDLSDDGSLLTWGPPTQNANCVASYRVCYTSDSTGDTDCVNVTESTWDYSSQGLAGCDTLSVLVTPVTGDGQSGPSNGISVSAPYGKPSEPTNYELSFLAEDEIFLRWDYPLSNPACIHDWSVVYGPVDDEVLYEASPSTLKSSLRADEQEFSAVVSGLLLCTNYSVAVAGVTIIDELGDEAVDYAKTADAPPGEIPNISFEPGTDQITISWGDGDVDACLATIKICYTDPVTLELICLDIDGGTDGSGSYTITGLAPCHSYGVVVEGLGSDGTAGSIHNEEVTTEDVAPGPVQSLKVIAKAVNFITVEWDAPLDYPDCVHEFIVGYTNLGDNSAARKTKYSANREDRAAEFADTMTGLSACSDYQIDVEAVTSTGKKSPIETVVGQTSDTAPGAPVNPQQLFNQADGVTMLWFAPEERFCVQRYHAMFIEEGGSQTIDLWYDPVDPYAEEFVYTFVSDDLLPCTSYVFQLEAFNPDYPSTDVAEVDVMTACPSTTQV